MEFNARAAALIHIDLTEEINDWRSARYGREVRSAQISALEKTQDQMNGAIDYITKKGELIDKTVEDVNQVKEEAEQAVTDAKEQAEAAAGSASEANQYKEDAAGSATLSESWAIGGTNTREGENTNNSKYYAGQSQVEANRARDEADRAAQYSSIVAPGFFLDPEDGTLYIKSGVGVDFAVDEDAIIYWKITAA